MASRNKRKPDIQRIDGRIFRPDSNNRRGSEMRMEDVLRTNLDVTTGTVTGPLSLLV